jgi:hypothetical protein
MEEQFAEAAMRGDHENLEEKQPAKLLFDPLYKQAYENCIHVITKGGRQVESASKSCLNTLSCARESITRI